MHSNSLILRLSALRTWFVRPFTVAHRSARARPPQTGGPRGTVDMPDALRRDVGLPPRDHCRPEPQAPPVPFDPFRFF